MQLDEVGSKLMKMSHSCAICKVLVLKAGYVQMYISRQGF